MYRNEYSTENKLIMNCNNYGSKAPIAVIMISLNEAHNIQSVIANIADWAQEIFLVDSFSTDETVNIAIQNGVHVVQRKFKNFGDQWNYALRELPIKSPWTMKLDPDERLTDELKLNISKQIITRQHTGISFDRYLWFMGRPLPIKQEVIRVWKTGTCKFTNTTVNEHPIIDGSVIHVSGRMEHLDSPNLHHWVEKQNRYTTMEAIAFLQGCNLAAKPLFWGTKLERRMWFKKIFYQIPFRYFIYFIYNLFLAKVWSSHKTGFTWAHLRVWVFRMRECKIREMQFLNSYIYSPIKQKSQQNIHSKQSEL